MWKCEILKFYTLIPIMEENLTRGRPMHLMHKNTCENKSHNEGREGGYQIPVPSLNLAQIPVPRLIFAKIPVTKFSVCITALFALTYLISSTILRRNLFRSHFYLPFTISSRHMQTCRTCPLTRKTDRT